MALLEGKTEKEKKQLIAAIALGAIAVGWLGYLFIFASSGSGGVTPANRNAHQNRTNTLGQTVRPPSTDGRADAVVVPPQPIDVNWQAPESPAPARNIFAYYVPPVVVHTPKASPSLTPTPQPTPPWILVGINPSNVFARTGDFNLEVTGDKFTPEAKVYVDGQEMPTQFTSAQRVTARVPAALIASPGARQIIVRSADGKLFSNTATLNIAAPPAPPYIYVGLLVKRGSADKSGKETALLKKQGTNDEIISVQRGDPVPDRFRVTNISKLSIELTDTQLNIKHTLPYTETNETATTNSFNGFRQRAPRPIAPGAIQPADNNEP